MYLYIFYCFYFVEEVSLNIAEEKAREKKYPDLEWEEHLRVSNDREEHW